VKTFIKSAIDRRVGKRIARIFRLPSEFAHERTINQIASTVNTAAGQCGLDDRDKYELFYRIGRRMLPDFMIADRGRLFLHDEHFVSCFQRFSPENWKPFERRWNLRQFLRQAQKVEGHFAECGVFEGANAFLMCEVAQAIGREVHLFDSCEGLSVPNEADGNFWKQGDLAASVEAVRRTLGPFSCYKIYKGWIPSEFPKVSHERYSFVHIDVDLEQPTYDSIAFFYPRLTRNGIILLDDHGFDTCPGARKAVLDFMDGKPEPVLDLSSGQGLIIKN
jgi:hypothetical protein